LPEFVQLAIGLRFQDAVDSLVETMTKFLLFLFLIPTAVVTFAAEPMSGESRFAQVEGNKVHYTLYGVTNPTLVFIHGWACDETVWDAQAAELPPQVRCITIDLPGHGKSDKPNTSYTMHLYARAIDAVLRDAKVQSAILVGHSNGVPVIRQFYREFPASVSGLIIVEGSLRPFVDAAGMEKFIASLRGPDYENAAAKFVDSMTRPIKAGELRQRIKTLMLRTPQYVSVSEFENTADPELWKPDNINVPVLMILAKQPIWTSEYEQFARSLVPRLDYQVWDNVSHFVMMEKPREFNDAVLAFLRANEFLLQKSQLRHGVSKLAWNTVRLPALYIRNCMLDP
jgi:pimeloyl-ACP methyl ester carboxylesterase